MNASVTERKKYLSYIRGNQRFLMFGPFTTKLTYLVKPQTVMNLEVELFSFFPYHCWYPFGFGSYVMVG